MPKLLDRFEKSLVKQGYSKEKAYAVATSKLQEYGYLKPGTTELTPKGIIKQRLPEGTKGLGKFDKLRSKIAKRKKNANQ